MTLLWWAGLPAGRLPLWPACLGCGFLPQPADGAAPVGWLADGSGRPGLRLSLGRPMAACAGAYSRVCWCLPVGLSAGVGCPLSYLSTAK
jgi:hypothetical protein